MRRTCISLYIGRQNFAGVSSVEHCQIFLVECILAPTRIASDVTGCWFNVWAHSSSACVVITCNAQVQSTEMKQEERIVHRYS
jgi:hypothetical protein